ncbi:MAG: MotA/TolQ/ExbB proton channel family protein [Flavobacteriales bacterium]|nr:MotA/TolQ/ExbB proton channel family protein [Flavobacteriales bacterium]MBK8950298.1 MotA/TolQ/ExbB proton channel family protein [Flavobacteriales bacterium]MBK9701026.1 MotA/TolQ/ExbB proton channel family protein [Flavobacteriales bacterium]
MLRLYGSKSDSDSPLDVPRRLVTRSCIVAIILGVVLSNLVLNGLWKLAEANLKSQELNLGAYVDFEDPADPRVLRAKKLLPPELHNKVKPEQLINDPDVDSLLRDDVITYADAETFLSAVAGWDRDNSPASVLLIGNLRYDYLGIAPLFDPEPPSEVLGRSEYDRPNFRSISVLEGRDLKYALGMELVTRLREKLTTNYFTPRRMLQALGGAIQTITFIIAIWGLLIVLLRWYWLLIQQRVLHTGRLIVDQERPEGVWEVLTTKPDRSPLFSEYIERYGDAFVAVRFLREAIASNAIATEAPRSFVDDRVDLMESRVLKGEYLLLDYINYAIPNLGFIGTILGIIKSMQSVVGILKSSGVLDMVEAFDKVGGALGLAFDTTFVSLVWVLVLSFMIARLQKREAELFDALREKGVLFLDRK